MAQMIVYQTCPSCGGALSVSNYPDPGSAVVATCTVCDAQWTFQGECADCSSDQDQVPPPGADHLEDEVNEE